MILPQQLSHLGVGGGGQHQGCHHIGVDNGGQWLSRSVAATSSSTGMGPLLSSARKASTCCNQFSVSVFAGLWRLRQSTTSAVMAMAQIQVLHDVLQSGIHWRVTLYCDSAAGALVRFEKTRKGGRLLHQLLARWSPLYGAVFILPRDQVVGGLVPKYLVEHIEAVLRGSPLPARRSEREQVRGGLVRAR